MTPQAVEGQRLMKEPQIGIEPMTARRESAETLALSSGGHDVENGNGSQGASEPRPNLLENGNEVATGKRCPRCMEHKTAEAFSRRRNGGMQPYCKPCASQNVRDWMERGNNRQRLYESVQRSKARYPEKEAARKVFRAAVDSGRLVAGPCEVGQGCAGVIEGHHDDYSKPLEVRWLCKFHHEAAHHVRAAA